MSDPGHEGERGYDHLSTVLAARSGPRRPVALPGLVREAVTLTYAAGRRTFLVTASAQLLGAALAGLQVLLAAHVLRLVLAAQVQPRDIGRAFLPLALLALVSAATAASSTLLAQRQRLLGELVTRHVWRRVLRVAGSVRLEELESAEFYDRLQRVETHALTQPLTLAQALVGLLGGGAGVLVLVGALAGIEPLLVPSLALAAVPLLLLGRRGSRWEFAFAVTQTPGARARDYLRQVLLGRDHAKEVRAYQLAAALTQRHDDLYAAYLDSLRAHLRRKTVLLLGGVLATALSTAVTLGLLVLFVRSGRLSIAEAGAALLAVRLLAARVQLLVTGVGQVFESSLFLTDLRAFLRDHEVRPAPLTSHDTGRPLQFDRLSARGLCFRYPGSTRDAVRDVDLDLDRGQVVAVVGENGSGKSTLARLLAGLYAPTAGTIWWDRTDLRDLDPAALRAGVAVMFQDFVRYQLTASDNVGLGRVERLDDKDAVRRAARRAGADSLLSGLPAGYDTILSKEYAQGRDLSGGQWQRVALARAFFRDARFLLLDEPSAALDPRAEHELFSSLRELCAGRTVLYVSHRFATVRQADRILVMAEGRVVESGDHDELMRLGGRYAELFALQADGFLPGGSR